MFSDQHKAAIGAILRDENGKVVMATSKAEVEVFAPEDIELLAVFRALQLCISVGIKKLVIESDCLLMIRDLQVSTESSTSLRVFLQETKKLLVAFDDYHIQCMSRLGNELAAHSLV